MDLPLVYIAIRPDLAPDLYLDEYLPMLAGRARLERWQGPGDPPLEVVREAISRAEVLVTGWGTPPLAEMLLGWSPEGSPLRLLAHTAGSVHHLVRREMLERGLLVMHANESLAEAVAEFTVGAILAMRRQMFLCAARAKASQAPPAYTTMREMPGSLVGIIGAGAIARRVLDLLRPWGVHFLLYDPTLPPGEAERLGAQPVDLLDLFRQSDIVSLHAPVRPETIGMIRAEHFAAMPQGALFVNTARGRLIDADGLLAALQSGRISALLDVTDPTEPLPPDSPFLQLDNCVVIQHQAANTLEARKRQGRYTVEDVLNYLEGKELVRRVRAERLELMA